MFLNYNSQNSYFAGCQGMRSPIFVGAETHQGSWRWWNWEPCRDQVTARRAAFERRGDSSRWHTGVILRSSFYVVLSQTYCLWSFSKYEYRVSEELSFSVDHVHMMSDLDDWRETKLGWRYLGKWICLPGTRAATKSGGSLAGALYDW